MSGGADFVQAQRTLRVESPLGADTLLAQKLNWREAISELFVGDLVVRSKNVSLVPQDLLGKTVDVSVDLGQGNRRTWNALVTNLRAGPHHTRDLREYVLTLRPDVWLLSQTSDCRIWLDKSAIDIANDLLGEHGITAPVTSGVVDPVPPQHYSVQWNETDLAYLTRRLEEDGLYYWWEHSEGAHQMHIASHASGYIGGEDVRFAHGSTDQNHISKFDTTFHYIPGKHAGRDWNFRTPNMVPGGDTPGIVNLPSNGNFERYTYPMQAGYGPGERASDGIEDSNVERVTKLRMLALEADHARVEGKSQVRTLAAGHRFTPFDVANPDNVFEEHIITAVEHHIIDLSYETVKDQPEFQNTFEALPSTIPLTPHLTTPRPRIDGAQVAIIAGPSGEEIHPDEYGRIKVWFPWDRRAVKDGTDTCWIRVMQNWAGTGWGGQIIPRIGMEVMVSYIDGDPDRPVVTGVVPNERQKVPYPLPDHKTKSVFRTDSHKSQGFNEISFEDATGAENIALHAQKDQTLKVLNNRMKRVDNDQVESVGDNKSIEVGNNHQERIGGSMNLTVGGGKTALFAGIATIMGQATSDALNVAEETGNPAIPAFLGAAVASTIGGEMASNPAISAFDNAGNNAAVAGADQIAKGTPLGALLSSTMPMSGIMNTVIEKFKSDTIGLARTEQIGGFKNTMVGAVQNTLVGAKQFTKIGQEQRLDVGKIKTVDVGDEYTTHSGRRSAHSSGNIYQISSKEKFEGTSKVWEIKAEDTILLSAPGGYIEITRSGIKIRGLKVDIEGNMIDFRTGGPGEGSKCLRAMAESATPFVRG